MEKQKMAFGKPDLNMFCSDWATTLSNRVNTVQYPVRSWTKDFFPHISHRKMQEWQMPRR